MESLKDLKGQLAQRQDELGALLGKGLDLLTYDDAAEIRRLNEECADIAIKVEQREEVETIQKGFTPESRVISGEDQPNAQSAPVQGKSLGDLIGETAGYKAYAKGGRMYAAAEASNADLKTTFTTTASTLTGYDRQPGMVAIGQMRLTVADLLARGQTTNNTIRYVQEDTFTNAATTVAEGATKPEAAFDTSEVDAPVRKIAVTAKVTDELFADFPAMRDYVNARLPFMVLQTEEDQLLNGNGTPPNLTGILNTSGIQTQAKGTDPTPDAIYKGIVKIRYTGFFEPDGYVTNPNDWQDVRLLRTADGIYIWGSPAEAGPERIWGLPVVVTTAIAANTGLVGAFKLGAQVFYRMGMTIETTNSNEDDFKKNLIAIRAEQREALAVYRPKAFCTITGI